MIMDGEQARDPTVPSGTYEYDLLVIGGGSGGLSCAKVIFKIIHDTTLLF